MNASKKLFLCLASLFTLMLFILTGCSNNTGVKEQVTGTIVRTEVGQKYQSYVTKEYVYGYSEKDGEYNFHYEPIVRQRLVPKYIIVVEFEDSHRETFEVTENLYYTYEEGMSINAVKDISKDGVTYSIE